MAETAEPPELYEPCQCCGGIRLTAENTFFYDLWDEVERAALSIYSGGSITHDPALLQATRTELQSRVTKGFGKDFPDIVYNSPDFDMLRNLTKNVYHFSAAKNYQQLKDMTVLLMDGEHLRSESEYLKAVETLNVKYNRDWLFTERNAAIAGGQMAGKWVHFPENAILRYVTVGDKRVRSSHRTLDRTRKPKKDTFWNTHYPPNGWNCRCDAVEEISGYKPTEDAHTPNVDVPEMFRTNLAEQGLIFPKAHPYYIGVPKAEIRKAIAYLPAKNTYLSVKGDNGTLIDVNVMHGDNEVQNNLIMANDLLECGYKDIHLLPDIHEKDAHLRRKFLPKEYEERNIRKNPDAWIKDKEGRDMVCDFKYMTGNGRRLASTIHTAAKQAEYAIIKLSDMNDLTPIRIVRTAQRVMSEEPHLKGVLILDDKGKIICHELR